LRAGQSALSLLLLATAQVQRGLQWELISGHAISPWSAALLVVVTVNYRRGR
jgi:uncharacterized protein (DUF952 family)